MPTCEQYVGLTSTQIFLPAGGSGSTTLTIPNNPIYSGIHVFAQSAAFAANTTPLGVIASFGLDLLTGTL